MNNECKLIFEALQGDHKAFAKLLNPYKNGYLNIAYRIVGSKEDAQEICQEALLKIYRYLASFKKKHSFKSWSYKIVVNCALDFLKRNKNHQYDQLPHDDFSDSDKGNCNPEIYCMKEEINQRLRECLQQLTPMERSVYGLREGENLSVKETSEILGCSSMSIRTHLTRARQKIKIQLGKIYEISPVNKEVKN